MQPIALDLDGFTDLPAGLFASVCTSLQAFALPPGHQPVALPQDFALQRLGGGDLARYRTLFRAAGEPWLWFTRLTWSDDRLAGVIGDDRVEAFALAGPAGDSGLLELDWRNDGAASGDWIAFVHLYPEGAETRVITGGPIRVGSTVTLQKSEPAQTTGTQSS